MSREVDDKHEAAFALTGQGTVALAEDRIADARRAFEEARKIRTTIGEAGAAEQSRIDLARVALAEEDFSAAQALASAAAAELEKQKIPDDQAVAFAVLARSFAAAGRRADAEQGPREGASARGEEPARRHAAGGAAGRPRPCAGRRATRPEPRRRCARPPRARGRRASSRGRSRRASLEGQILAAGGAKEPARALLARGREGRRGARVPPDRPQGRRGARRMKDLLAWCRERQEAMTGVSLGARRDRVALDGCRGGRRARAPHRRGALASRLPGGAVAGRRSGSDPASASRSAEDRFSSAISTRSGTSARSPAAPSASRATASTVRAPTT